MKVNARVHLTDPNGDFVVLVPGDEIPDWATVTNPDVLDESESDDDEAAEKAAAEAAEKEAAEKAAAETPAKRAPAKKAAPASE